MWERLEKEATDRNYKKLNNIPQIENFGKTACPEGGSALLPQVMAGGGIEMDFEMPPAR